MLDDIDASAGGSKRTPKKLTGVSPGVPKGISKSPASATDPDQSARPVLPDESSMVSRQAVHLENTVPSLKVPRASAGTGIEKPPKRGISATACSGSKRGMSSTAQGSLAGAGSTAMSEKAQLRLRLSPEALNSLGRREKANFNWIWFKPSTNAVGGMAVRYVCQPGARGIEAIGCSFRITASTCSGAPGQ